MITLQREKAEKLWEKYWGETQDEWFKVEVLQDYSGEDTGPSLKAWLDGDKPKSIEIMKNELVKADWIKDFANSKFKKIRIHIVEKPKSPYLLWEIEHYKHINIPLGGEQVYLIDKSKTEGMEIPDGDLMIFDKKRVVRNHYRENGRMYKADFYNEKDSIDRFLSLRAKLLKSASSLWIYLKK